MARDPSDEPDGADMSPDDSEPQLYALNRVADGYQLSRRSLLGAAAAIGGSAALTGCGSRNESTGDDLIRLGGGRVFMDGAKSCPYRAHVQAVTSLAATAETLATGSRDGTLKLWALPDGDLLKRVAAATPLAMAASPDGLRLAAASQASSELCLRYLPEGAVAGPPLMVGAPGWPLAWSADGSTLATGAGAVVQLWSIVDRRLLGELRQHTAPVTSLGFSPNGKLLVCGSSDRTASIWSLPTRKLLGVATGHTKPVTSVCFAGGSRVASAADDATVRLWATDGAAIRTVVDGNVTGAVVASPPGGRQLATSSGNTIRLWALRSEAPPRKLALHAAPVTCLAYTPDGRYLVSGDAQGMVIVWDCELADHYWSLWDVSIDKRVEVRLCRLTPKTYGMWEMLGQTTLTCTCDLVWAAQYAVLGHHTCLCDKVMLNGKPSPIGSSPTVSAKGPAGCYCDLICTCDKVPATPSGGGGRGSSTYWYPN